VKQIIEIIVTPEGKASVQTLGFTGSSCREASRFLEEALGQRTAEVRTAEFYQSQPVNENQRQQLG
jgi:uroporphyrinogen-III synthase